MMVEERTHLIVGGSCVSTTDLKNRLISLSVCLKPVLLFMSAITSSVVKLTSVASSSEPLSFQLPTIS